MSTVTPVLGLIKPGDSEYIDVADLNANFDALDAAWLAQDIIRVTDSDPLDPVTAVSAGQIQFKDNSVWKGLDEVRLYNNSDALYCKDGVTTGLLMQNNQIKIVPVTWNNGVPAVGTTKGYIDANGDYHSANTSLETLRESVNSYESFSVTPWNMTIDYQYNTYKAGIVSLHVKGALTNYIGSMFSVSQKYRPTNIYSVNFDGCNIYWMAGHYEDAKFLQVGYDNTYGTFSWSAPNVTFSSDLRVGINIVYCIE